MPQRVASSAVRAWRSILLVVSSSDDESLSLSLSLSSSSCHDCVVAAAVDGDGVTAAFIIILASSDDGIAPPVEVIPAEAEEEDKI